MAKHFENKDALAHVMQRRVEGMSSIEEAHGKEMPGHLSAAADALRESSIALLLVWLILFLHPFPTAQAFLLFIAFGLGWSAWKGGRSGWLGWARLERLHRLIEQEKFEIEHHRPQEREELEALYRAKGFEGKLLNDVIDVLMADQDRLLKVMLEEEMGLTLEAYEHPLQQTVGGIVGALIALVGTAIPLYFFPSFGVPLAAFFLLLAASLFSARFEGNRLIPAAVWNISIGALSVGVTYFLYKIFYP